MNEAPLRFTLDELAALAELPRRTVRYYLQIGLLDKPGGLGRGAHYDSRLPEVLNLPGNPENSACAEIFYGLTQRSIHEDIGD